MDNDLISRQAAIDALKRDEALVRAFGYQHAIEAIQALPSAEPERKKGKIVQIRSNRFYYGCSECGAPIPTDSQIDYIDQTDIKFCFNCGADLRGEANETD